MTAIPEADVRQSWRLPEDRTRPRRYRPARFMHLPTYLLHRTSPYVFSCGASRGGITRFLRSGLLLQDGLKRPWRGDRIGVTMGDPPLIIFTSKYGRHAK